MPASEACTVASCPWTLPGRVAQVIGGATQGTFNVGSNPDLLAFDGANIWVTNNGSATVTKLRANDGAVLGTFSTGSNPQGIAFDGANIWVGNVSAGTVSKL